MLKKSFDFSVGPFFLCLRNAYRPSMSSAKPTKMARLGNHVHKLLKVKVHKVTTSLLIHLSLLSVTTLCDSIKNGAVDYPSAQSHANRIANKFAQAFELFGKFHRL